MFFMFRIHVGSVWHGTVVAVWGPFCKEICVFFTFRIHLGSVVQGRISVFHVPDTCGARLARTLVAVWGPFCKEI